MVNHTFPAIRNELLRELVDAPEVDVGTWHAMDVSDKPQLVSHELQNVVFEMGIPQEPWLGPDEGYASAFDDWPTLNKEWAEEHFQERVSGKPLNPPPSHVRWPWASHNEKHQADEKFSHTYPERMWCKFAPHPEFVTPITLTREANNEGHVGIRFVWGDLNTLIRVLKENPYTRQAYLPIWFPEDLTAADQGERVPCTLGYHFMVRNYAGTPRLNVTYMIRSCDFLRYFADDVYMACRLGQWVLDQLSWGPAIMGQLTFHTMSLHVFKGDLPRLAKEIDQIDGKANSVRTPKDHKRRDVPTNVGARGEEGNMP